ncbi:tectonic-2 isoform X1 [Gouania willdenowi]|nr:tectonic-2 isoform X1 [Gouania willdenowi]
MSIYCGEVLCMDTLANMLYSVAFILRPTYLFIFISLVHTQNIVDFQPSFITTTGPTVSAYLLGNSSGVSLNLKTVFPVNTTGSLPSPSCAPEVTQWAITKESLGKAAIKVQLKLNQSLRLCVDNDTNTDCCSKPLCVLETLQLSACVDGVPQASLLIQARIHALLLPANVGSDNASLIPNQVYQPLGSCPCDLTFRACDVRCCCDKDCSKELLRLFLPYCLPGPFGGAVPPVPEYQCSEKSSQNSPDWFPFLCVHSPIENNPHLGLFYHGNVIPSKPTLSFQRPQLSAPMPFIDYIQGNPIFTLSDQYLTIPQRIFGRCVNGAPLAFLENVNVNCVTWLSTCSNGSPLHTVEEDLRANVKNGKGGSVMVDVIDQLVTDLSPFISESDDAVLSDGRLVCENVTLALDYKFYWMENSITSIILTRTVGTVSFRGNVTLTTKYSAVFLNGVVTSESISGNPGYQVGRPVIGGFINTLGNNTNNNTDLIQKMTISIWKTVNDGLCSTADQKPLLFGMNSTSGCLLQISKQNLSRCDPLRDAVSSLQEAFITATHVAKIGNPDVTTLRDWLNVTFEVDTKNSSPASMTSNSCSHIPSHQHIHIRSRITGMVEGEPQRQIWAVHVSYSRSIWTLECGGGDLFSCEDEEETQLFPITSSVTFTEVPVNTGPPKTRFQINFTEYDCERNDVCWPELAFPLTPAYTGEPYSQALAKGMILVFFFITASILGTPWKQIREAWNTAAL